MSQVRTTFELSKIGYLETNDTLGLIKMQLQLVFDRKLGEVALGCLGGQFESLISVDISTYIHKKIQLSSNKPALVQIR